jgi:predicted permease
MYNSYPKAGVDRSSASIANYFERRDTLRSASSVSLYADQDITVGVEGSPQRVNIARVTPEFFKTVGVSLQKGAMFTDANLTFQTDQVAVITNEFWRNYFNADPNIVGRTFLNDGLVSTVIGVLPPNFHFLSSKAQFFRPASHDASARLPASRHNNGFQMVARLAPGMTVANLQAEVDALNAKLFSVDPYGPMTRDAGFHTIVRPLHAEHIRSVKPILLLLQCGVLFLLLIGCVNLVNLLLIRASNRSKEYAVRQALGAQSFRIATEVLAETALLALGGCLYGVLLGVFSIDFLHTLGTDQLPLGAQIQLDGRVCIAAVVAALGIAVALAVPIVIYVLKMKMSVGLQSESRTGTAGRGAQRLRHIFIVAQIAMAFVLLSGAALLTTSLRKILATPPGFTTRQILTGKIVLPWKGYPNGPDRLAFIERLVPAIKAIPGISSAAITSNLPFSEMNNDSAVTVLDHRPTPGQPLRAHYLSNVSGDYWKTMGISLLQGRLLTDADNHATEPRCVVDEAFADYYWPHGGALGRKIMLGAPNGNNSGASTIVGVVNSVTQQELTEAKAHGAVYFTYNTLQPSGFYLVVRTALPAETAIGMIRKTVLSLDPELPVDDWKAMEDRIDDSLVARRSPTILASIFAATALLLAALGTYGVLSYAVAQRRTEISVRIALGAQPWQIRRQFLLLGTKLLVIGAVIGIVCAWLTSSVMKAMLFDSGGLHIETFLGTLVVMSIVSLSACFFPARRATKIDPAFSMRA